MAYDDDDIPFSWSDSEMEFFDDFVGGEPELVDDTELQMLFHEALFDRDVTPGDREHFRDDLEEYLWDKYEIDFNEIFDWEAYREAYDAA